MVIALHLFKNRIGIAHVLAQAVRRPVERDVVTMIYALIVIIEDVEHSLFRICQ